MTPENIMRIAKEFSPQAASLLMLMDKLEESMGLGKSDTTPVTKTEADWPTLSECFAYYANKAMKFDAELTKQHERTSNQ